MAVAQPGDGIRWMLRGQRELPSTDAWLSAAEAERARALRLTKRRTEYLLRRWVCKHAVAATVGLPDHVGSLHRVEVSNLPSGAPSVLLDGAPLGMSVSLTDRAGWAVCALADGAGPIGCDLERVEPRSPQFVADFMTEAERDHVSTLTEAAERDLTANLFWSAKESALKVLGTGLRRDTRSVEVTVDGDHPTGAWNRLRIATGGVRELPGWWCREGAFVLTVASVRRTAAPSLLIGSALLGDAEPTESWLENPLAP